MSLAFYLTEVKEVDVFGISITHNLIEMARMAGVYEALWRPEELGIKKAKELIPHLEPAIDSLKENPAFYKQLNAKNGWGTYENFVSFVDSILTACKNNPEAKVEVSR